MCVVCVGPYVVIASVRAWCPVYVHPVSLVPAPPVRLVARLPLPSPAHGPIANQERREPEGVGSLGRTAHKPREREARAGSAKEKARERELCACVCFSHRFRKLV